jgi:ABC-type phosphate/phosphonate transport system substrate-binding protein
MYSFPELHSASSSLWRGIAKHLRREGMTDVPDDLAQGRPLAELWSNNSLLLSQCCGYDVVRRYRDTLIPLATPVFDVPECSGREYSSLIVVSDESHYIDVLDMHGTIAVANGPESHSGMSSLRQLVAPKHNNGRFFSNTIYSGSHAASLDLIRKGKADIAAVDCVTFRLLEVHKPETVVGIKILGRTFHAPAPPYVTHAHRGDDVADRLRTALLHAFHDPYHETDRAALLIKGIDPTDMNIYEKITDFEVYAAKLGYPHLQ